MAVAYRYRTDSIGSFRRIVSGQTVHIPDRILCVFFQQYYKLVKCIFINEGLAVVVDFSTIVDGDVSITVNRDGVCLGIKLKAFTGNSFLQGICLACPRKPYWLFRHSSLRK